MQLTLTHHFDLTNARDRRAIQALLDIYGEPEDLDVSQTYSKSVEAPPVVTCYTSTENAELVKEYLNTADVVESVEVETVEKPEYITTEYENELNKDSATRAAPIDPDQYFWESVNIDAVPLHPSLKYNRLPDVKVKTNDVEFEGDLATVVEQLTEVREEKEEKRKDPEKKVNEDQVEQLRALRTEASKYGFFPEFKEILKKEHGKTGSFKEISADAFGRILPQLEKIIKDAKEGST